MTSGVKEWFVIDLQIGYSSPAQSGITDDLGLTVAEVCINIPSLFPATKQEVLYNIWVNNYVYFTCDGHHSSRRCTLLYVGEPQ